MTDTTTATEPKKVSDLTFHKVASRCHTVTTLESNSLELEESLRAYEGGVALLADLQARLANAQQKVDVLMGQLDAPADDATTDSTLS